MLRLARAADRVVSIRGAKTTVFDMRDHPPDADTLAAALLGPTGNLRAPTIQHGRTLIVGFGADAYARYLLP